MITQRDDEIRWTESINSFRRHLNMYESELIRKKQVKFVVLWCDEWDIIKKNFRRTQQFEYSNSEMIRLMLSPAASLSSIKHPFFLKVIILWNISLILRNTTIALQNLIKDHNNYVSWMSSIQIKLCVISYFVIINWSRCRAIVYCSEHETAAAQSTKPI